MMHNIKLLLEYDGTNYHGWQSQAGSGQPTIQDTLEAALAQIAGHACPTVSSGRTDAGVHALGHVANFRTSHSMPPEAWAPALNHLLPQDIRVLASEAVPDDFHARFSARSKRYCYRILNRKAETALHRNYTWHVKALLDLEAMQAGAAHLTGRHDFSAFRGAGCTAKTPVRTLQRLDLTREGDLIFVKLEADAFLQYMVRNIVGTLVEVGLGRFSPQDVLAILESCDRTRAGRTAPPQGLYLETVFYF